MKKAAPIVDSYIIYTLMNDIYLTDITKPENREKKKKVTWKSENWPLTNLDTKLVFPVPISPRKTWENGEQETSQQPNRFLNPKLYYFKPSKQSSNQNQKRKGKDIPTSLACMFLFLVFAINALIRIPRNKQKTESCRDE